MSELTQNRNNPLVQIEETGMFLLMKKIDEESCAAAIRFILTHNAQPNTDLDHLTLIVNSPGGSVHAGLALIDVMKGSKIPVHTVGLGLIASCGLLIFMSGEKGHRTLTPNTSILSHQYSWGGSGKAHELFARQKEFEMADKRLLELYKKATGLNEKTVKEKLLPPHDVWLSAAEAKKFKLCDHVKEMK
jgi:ATP-dependent Clp protease, protease subunit